MNQDSILLMNDDEIWLDWLDTDTIVNSLADISPVDTLIEILDTVPDFEPKDEYPTMPQSLRCVLLPDGDEVPARTKSLLFEQPLPSESPATPSCHQEWSQINGILKRSRSSTSIASCSTTQTRTVPAKSIVTRHSYLSTATTISGKKRSAPSVKFVDAPTIHYDYDSIPPTSPPTSPRKSKFKAHRWLTQCLKKTTVPQRPTISGPYNLAYTPSLVDVCGVRASKLKHSRFKKFWPSFWEKIMSRIG